MRKREWKTHPHPPGNKQIKTSLSFHTHTYMIHPLTTALPFAHLPICQFANTKTTTFLSSLVFFSIDAIDAHTLPPKPNQNPSNPLQLAPIPLSLLNGHTPSQVSHGFRHRRQRGRCRSPLLDQVPPRIDFRFVPSLLALFGFWEPQDWVFPQLHRPRCSLSQGLRSRVSFLSLFLNWGFWDCLGSGKMKWFNLNPHLVCVYNLLVLLDCIPLFTNWVVF